jgi:hypothetical protein
VVRGVNSTPSDVVMVRSFHAAAHGVEYVK